ncbi:hypothetical protein ACIKTA_07440, partial [Hansschlegelia beijingensis]
RDSLDIESYLARAQQRQLEVDQKIQEAWGRLAAELTENDMADAAAVVGLEDLPALADAILAGQVRGRTIVDVRK